MFRRTAIAVAAMAAAGTDPSVHTGGSGAGLEARVRLVPMATLPDVAVAGYDATNPIVYYNPERMQRFSPALQSFLMAHVGVVGILLLQRLLLVT